jgi:osmotically-inducible protein OsmY
MRTAIAFSSVGILLLAGCSTVSNIKAVGPTDSDLEQTIKARLASDPAMQTANLGVAANASNNQATLWGTLPSEDLRGKAVELAKSAQPNLVVNDKIEVRPPEVSRNDYTEDMARVTRKKAKELGDQVGRSLDDAWLYSKIVTRLAADPDTSALKVHVDVTNKVVTLRGHVESSTAKTEAERLARDTEGVTAVYDHIAVTSGA